MAEILSDALKESQCKILLRLIAGLTDGARAAEIHANITPGRRGREVIAERRIDWDAPGSDYKQQSRAPRYLWRPAPLTSFWLSSPRPIGGLFSGLPTPQCQPPVARIMRLTGAPE